MRLPPRPARARPPAPAECSCRVVTALRKDVPVTVEASGTVTPINQVDLRAQTTSTVRDVLVKDGQTVSKGQVLFRFDERADRANLDKARAQLARDKANLSDLQRQYDRAKELLAQNPPKSR
ncbi:biotin-lipoyl like domain-containing protein [Ditylenchus destructor]|nr:biotin-lipoyl like domain-containing protein [Ditylenchus destructor]